MEPDDVAEYSRQSYWEKRYSSESQYNWFPSVHDASVRALCDELMNVFQLRGACGGSDSTDCSVLRVLHLGTGNSSLCMDLYKVLQERQPPFTLEQVAMDYAPNVIANMQAKYPPEVLPNTTWRVGDVRRLEEFRSLGPFDVIIDKGTMDALEADKDSPTMEDDIEAMLHGVDGLLQHTKGYGAFMQITWVVPYMRLHYTKGDTFSWGDQGELGPVVSPPQREEGKASVMAVNLLLRCLRSRWASAAINSSSTCMPHTVAVRYATAEKSGGAKLTGGTRRHGKNSEKVRTSRKTRKETSGVADNAVKGATEIAAAAVTPSPPQETAASVLQSSHWVPTEAEYEALVANLMLYRRESLEPVLCALQKERALFEESVKKMETRIAEMYALREEIRELLQDGAAMQRRALAEALCADTSADGVAKDAEETAATKKKGGDDDDDDDGEICL